MTRLSLMIIVAIGVSFVTTVPCKQLAGVIDEVEERKEIFHIPSNKEDEGMGLCAGAWMGGKRPMIGSEILREIAPILHDQMVVCNIGLPSQEPHMIDDNAKNFNMLGTMGLSSSIGLGLALAQDKTVISIDGDGSVLTNLGTLPTIANGSYGSTGDQPTYAGKKTKLEAVAAACGCENVVTCQDVDTGKVLQAAIDSKKMTVIVVKCDSGNIKLPVITMDPVVIRHRFTEAVKA